MQLSLALTGLVMGVVGGPHCIAMCGAACFGIGHAARPRNHRALLAFQFGRLFGYAILGALAAASIQGLVWLTVRSAALRPVWSLLHVALLVLGMVLLVRARQPIWLEHLGRQVWLRARGLGAAAGGGPVLLGILWALLPCGLLYSALLVASMASSALEGALVMACFAAGSGFTLVVGPWLWLRWRGSRPFPFDGSWGVRLAGIALAGSSTWALWMAFAHNQAPWCVTL